jgi:hypothetical protein
MIDRTCQTQSIKRCEQYNPPLGALTRIERFQLALNVRGLLERKENLV